MNNLYVFSYYYFQSLLVHHEIVHTGEYVFFMAVCDENAAPIVLGNYHMFIVLIQHCNLIGCCCLDGHIESLDPCELNSIPFLNFIDYNCS